MLAFEPHKPFPWHPSDSDLVSFPLCAALLSLHESGLWDRAHPHTVLAQGAESSTPALHGSITELSEEALQVSCHGSQSPLCYTSLEAACCWNHTHMLSHTCSCLSISSDTTTWKHLNFHPSGRLIESEKFSPRGSWCVIFSTITHRHFYSPVFIDCKQQVK